MPLKILVDKYHVYHEIMIVEMGIETIPTKNLETVLMPIHLLWCKSETQFLVQAFPLI